MTLLALSPDRDLRAKILTPADAPRVVHHRVDALTQAFRVKIHRSGDPQNPGVLEKLYERGRIANVHGRAAFYDAAGEAWELKVPRRGDGGLWRLRREDHVRIQIDMKAAGGTREFVDVLEPAPLDYKNAGSPRLSGVIGKVGWQASGKQTVIEDPGWTLELIWYAHYLAQNDLASVLEEGREIAARFGEVIEDRLRRIDLCADVAGFEIESDDYRNFSRKSHVKVYPFTNKPKGDDGFRNSDFEVREVDLPALCDMIAEGKIAGIRVGTGDVVGCVYDKRKHLADLGRADKTHAEEARWLGGGWNGLDPISRVEIRLRGEALVEVGARKPECVDPESGEILPLKSYVPRIWATFLKWLRLTVPASSRRGRPIAMSRRETDPRWKILAAIDWKIDCAECRDAACSCLEHQRPIRRIRVRGGATAAQALGAMISTVAAAGKLHDVVEASEDIRDYIEQGAQKLRALLSIITHWGIDVIAAKLTERWGSPEGAAQHLAHIMNAARGRFPFAREGPGGNEHEPVTISKNRVRLLVPFDPQIDQLALAFAPGNETN